MTNVENLTPDQVKHLDTEIGSIFGRGDRLFQSFTDHNIVSLGYDITPLEMARMLAGDGNARKIERVLSLPVRGAPQHITGSNAEAVDLVTEVMSPMLDKLVEQCTAAFVYRRSYFEKVWTVDSRGRYVYDQLAWRPPQSCTPRFDRATGQQQGFNQRITDAGWWAAITREGEVPGQVTIPAVKSFIYTHGRHREPVKGVSELEVAYNAFTKKQKLRFMWAQYLENQSLPKLVVYGDDTNEAQKNADLFARARASGIVPAVRRADDPDAFQVIESSGRGADQFENAIRYYDWEQTNSVLAGFTELASAASSGVGSYALSADQSEFFLASEQAVADEIADQIREQVFEPLIVLNLGAEVEVPKLRIGPIGNRQTDRALALLEKVVTAHRPNVPYEFIGFLLNQVSEALGLDTAAVDGSIEAWATRMEAEMEAAQAAQVAAASQPVPMMAPPSQQPLPGVAEATRSSSPAR